MSKPPVKVYHTKQCLVSQYLEHPNSRVSNHLSNAYSFICTCLPFSPDYTSSHTYRKKALEHEVGCPCFDYLVQCFVPTADGGFTRPFSSARLSLMERQECRCQDKHKLTLRASFVKATEQSVPHTYLPESYRKFISYYTPRQVDYSKDRDTWFTHSDFEEGSEGNLSTLDYLYLNRVSVLGLGALLVLTNLFFNLPPLGGYPVSDEIQDVRDTFDTTPLFYAYIVGMHTLIILDMLTPGYDSFLITLNSILEGVFY